MLNLRKIAGAYLTLIGRRMYEQLLEASGMDVELEPGLFTILQFVQNDPSTSLTKILGDVKTFSGAPDEEKAEIRSAWINAINNNYIVYEGLPVTPDQFSLPGNIPEGIASKLNMKKKATTYSVQLLYQMTQDLDRVSANYTIDGVEAVVNFQGEGIEPQQYHIRITPMADIERQQETTGDRGEYSWGAEGPPPGIANASKLNMKKKATLSLDEYYELFPKGVEAGYGMRILSPYSPENWETREAALQDLAVLRGFPQNHLMSFYDGMPGSFMISHEYLFHTSEEVVEALKKVSGQLPEESKLIVIPQIYDWGSGNDVDVSSIIDLPLANTWTSEIIRRTFGDRKSQYNAEEWVNATPIESALPFGIKAEFTEESTKISPLKNLDVPGQARMPSILEMDYGDLPENLPPGIANANKLNMKKKAEGPTYEQLQNALNRDIITPIQFSELVIRYGLNKQANTNRLNMKKALEIGGETFPDALKFKEETTSPLDVETDVQKLYKDAESFIVNYIWSGLAAEGIVSPDDANVIQTDVDKVQFSGASSLVNQLMAEGWFAYLKLSYDTKLRTDPQLQQQIFNTIQNEIKEGAV